MFGSGFLAGMKLVGFSLWKSPEGELYVTFPSRAFGGGSERRFFDFLRGVEGDAAPVVSGGQETRESDGSSRRERSTVSFSATSGLILAARYWT